MSPASGNSTPAPFLADPPITEDTLRPFLRTQLFGRAVFAFRECDSTNAAAMRLLDAARAGTAPWPANGTLIVADYQRAGRGRSNTSWSAAPGTSLLFSLILYPSGWAQAAPPPSNDPATPASIPSAPGWPPAATHPSVPSTAHLLTMAAGLAVVRALEAVGAAGCTIKWPNDVLDPHGRKLCGALTESATRGPAAPPALVAGVGINVTQREEDFPPELRARASSARLAAGRPVARAQLLARFLEELEATLELSDASLFRAWERRCSTLGRIVRARLAGRPVVGQALAVETDGSLVLRLESGVQQVVRSADVEEVRVQEAAEAAG